MKNDVKINDALISKNAIEFFRTKGHYFAVQGGVTYRVIPGTKMYVIALGLAVKHPSYAKLKAKYQQNVVYGFIDEYLSGFNNLADVVGDDIIDMDGDVTTSIGNITEREKQIIYLSSEGLADKQIANILGTAPNTVVKQFQNLREKFHATSKYHVVSMAAKAGII